MKKKLTRTAIIIAVLLIFLGVLKAAILYVGNIFVKEYFKDEYIQIIYPTSISDYLVAKEVLDEVEEAFATITSYDNAQQKFGELGRFCITDDDAVKETHKVNLISAKFKNNKGYIWIKYTSEACDDKGECVCGSSNILAKLKLEKVDNNWIVTSIKEHP